MSRKNPDFHFGMGRGHLPEKADAIARKHGAQLVNHTEPDGQKRHWFRAENVGEPQDRERAKAIFADLRQAGISL